MRSKKADVLYGLILGFFMNAILSVTAPVLFGQQLTVMTCLMGFALAYVISIVLNIILPLEKMSAGFLRSFASTPGTVAGNLLALAMFGTVYGVVIIFAFVAVSTGFGGLDGVNFASRYVSSFLTAWPVIVIALGFSQALTVPIIARLLGGGRTVEELA